MKPKGGATTSVFNINVKPIIAELARTEVCFPNIQLLVDKIIVQPLPDRGDAGEPRGAFRLWLTDGECTIQGRRTWTTNVHVRSQISSSC